MAKQIKSRRVTTRRVNESMARQLWLASLGAAALTRKQSIKLYSVMIEEGRALQSKVLDSVGDVGNQVNQTIANVRAKVEGAVEPVRQRVEATYIVLKDEVGSRLQPVLARFGIARAPVKASKAKRPVRAAGKTVRRTVKRKAA